MKLLKQGLGLVLVTAGLAAIPAVGSGSTGVPASAPGDPTVQDMRDTARGPVKVDRERATGKVDFARSAHGKGDLLPDFDDDAGARSDRSVRKAEAYLDEFGELFGADRGLVRARVAQGPRGTTVSFTQRHRGVPVFGSEIKAHLDRQGDLTSVNGFAVPDLDVDTEPGVEEAEVEKRALAFVEEDPPTSEDGEPADTKDVEALATELVIYRKGFTSGERGEPVLAYAVEVGNGATIRDMVILEAEHGKILNRWSMVHAALDRKLYEGSPDSDPVWEEGDEFPGDLNQDQRNLVNSAGEAYWLYMNAFGRDSYDGAGATMRTVNNDPRINCPNANWNGQTTNYCDGVTSDDVVAHEWGHAYTEHTSGLIYQYQSGALNESYSDVWGETLDLINRREDQGETFTPKRPDGECESTAPAGLEVEISAPESVAGPCTAAAAGFGPEFTTEPVTTDAVVATDAADEGGPSTTDGCSSFTNSADVAGLYAYVDRGSCTFQQKVDNASAAGAVGLVVGNNVPGALPFPMSATGAIPGFMVTHSDGVRFKEGGTVNITVQAEDTSGRVDSTRWLVGEKSEAFGGAIRDMWTPTCHGHPGKVSDAEYACDPNLTDGGGVHTNSGVPNHAYALAVDGGTYNGETLEGLGLDKSAHVWWRAQSQYLTPSSDFTDAANALEASCADLVGQEINKLTTEPDATPTSAPPITEADCDELAKALAAVEMRAPVEKCDFQPILDKDTPALCGEGSTTKELWSEDFEDGLEGWETEQELAEIDLGGGNVYRGGFGQEWEATSEAPGDHQGGVVHGPAPNEGQCTGDGETDFSSRDSIVSPEIELPEGDLRTPRLSFDHYVATEAGYDGGNVKVSLNGGDFETVPAAAYVFNAPDRIYSLAEGNTNPLGGQDGFTGTDGGESHGSWGTSQIDLGALGAEDGDTIRLRFDVGRDGCGGIDGWYVDDVRVTLCQEDSTTSAAAKPSTVNHRKPFTKVSVDVTAADTAPTGEVEIVRDGDVLATGTVRKGTAKVRLPVRGELQPGEHELEARFLGSSSVAPSSGSFTVTVR